MSDELKFELSRRRFFNVLVGAAVSAGLPLSFGGMERLYGGPIGGGMSDEHMYFINTDFLFYGDNAKPFGLAKLYPELAQQVSNEIEEL